MGFNFYHMNQMLADDLYAAWQAERAAEDAERTAVCDNCHETCSTGDLVDWMGDEQVCPKCFDELQRELFGMEDD